VLDHPKTLPGLKPIKLLSELKQETSKQNPLTSLAGEQVSLVSEAEETLVNKKCFSLGPFQRNRKATKCTTYCLARVFKPSKEL